MTIKSKKTTCRKLLSFILVFLLTLMIAIPASVGTKVMAADDYSITIENSEHLADMITGQFAAYQIFSGNIQTTEKASSTKARHLADITWGKNIDSAKLLDALKNSADAAFGTEFNSITGSTSAEEIARILEKHSDNKFLQAFAKLVETTTDCLKGDPKTSTLVSGEDKSIIDGLEPGYYMVVDTVNNKGGEEAAGKVISEFILAVIGNQTVNIKADIPTVTKQIMEDNTYNKPVGLGCSATINDTVYFKIEGTLAENYADYTAYQYTINDTLTRGLKYNDGSLNIKIGTQNYTEAELKGFNASKSDVFSYSNDGYNIVINFKDLKSFDPSISIDKDTAIIVTYSAKGTTDANVRTADTNTVYIEYSDDPDNVLSGGAELGKTKEAVNNVYNFGLDITKNGTDSGSTGLEGAKFTLYRISDDHYAMFDATGKITGGSDTYAGSTNEVTSDASGKITISGLAAGKYILKEVKAPDGYNTMEDIYFEVEAKYNPEGTLESLTFNTLDSDEVSPKTRDDVTPVAGSTANHTISVTLVDERAPLLPFTGGMGTYIFYALGGILLAGAAIYIVCTRFRKQNR